MRTAKRVSSPVANLREFFRDSVHGALAKQHVAVDEQTEQYVVNLLTLFARSEALYEQTAEGARLKPLALMLCEALEAPTARARNRCLQRLGDVSLFIAGFFAQGFAAKLIDIDYHIAMGGRAYGTLAEATARGSAVGAGGGVRRARAEIPAAGGRAERGERELLPSHATRTSCASTRCG